MADPQLNPSQAAADPYAGLRNLLELIVPRVLEHYLTEVVEVGCDCIQCRRDMLACALSSLRPVYYGSYSAEDLANPQIQLRTISIENIDQQVRRAIAFVSEAPHHARAKSPVEVETARPEELTDKIMERLLARPLLEQLYGVPVPMCLHCNEVGRRAESLYCDRCGKPLVQGLPSTSLRLR